MALTVPVGWQWYYKICSIIPKGITLETEWKQILYKNMLFVHHIVVFSDSVMKSMKKLSLNDIHVILFDCIFVKI